MILAQRHSVSLMTAITICGLSVAGCGSGSSVTYAPVSGTVRFNGEPAANVRISFTPQALPGPDAPFASAATTDADGHYELVTLSTTNSRRGASVGSHEVRFSRVNPIGRELLPAKFNQDSTFTWTVENAGTQSADFDLIDESLQPVEEKRR